jgi:hypothetical protein
MIMSSLSNLDKLDLVPKVIDHFLVPLCLPPFNGHVEFATGHYNPKWSVFTGKFVYLRKPRFLQIRDVDVSSECRRSDAQMENIV